MQTIIKLRCRLCVTNEIAQVDEKLDELVGA